MMGKSVLLADGPLAGATVVVPVGVDLDYVELRNGVGDVFKYVRVTRGDLRYMDQAVSESVTGKKDGKE